MTGLTSDIEDFVGSNFSSEQAQEFFNTRALAEAFEEDTLGDRIRDVLYDIGNDDNDARQLAFAEVFHTVADKILSAHDLAMLTPVKLHTKNRILSALYRIQTIEDPVPYSRILETSLSNEEMFAKIVSSVAEIDEGTVLESVDEISDDFINGLRSFLEDRERNIDSLAGEDQEGLALRTTIIGKLKCFFECFGENMLVSSMSDIGLLPAQSTLLYWPYVKDNIVMTSDKETALNLLGLFIYGSDTYMNPMGAYERCSESLVKDNMKRVAIANQLRDAILALDNYMKAKDDAKRVSAV